MTESNSHLPILKHLKAGYLSPLRSPYSHWGQLGMLLCGCAILKNEMDLEELLSG